VNSRKLAGASAASVGAATAVVALLLGSVSGNATEEGPTASAYGISSEGLLPIAPTPSVEAPPGGEQNAIEVPDPLGVGVLNVKAEGYQSDAKAVDINLLSGAVKASLIEAKCDNGQGTSQLIGDIAGSPLPSAPDLGQNLDLSPLLKVELNRQTHDDSGALTVDALVVSLLPGGNGQLPVNPGDLSQLQGLAPSNLKVPTLDQLQQAKQADTQAAPGAVPAVPTVDDLIAQIQHLNPNLALPAAGDGPLLEIVVSSATCRAEEGPKAPEKPGEAPKPKPVETQLPVTH
jgi:hypothetical protein